MAVMKETALTLSDVCNRASYQFWLDNLEYRELIQVIWL